MKRKIRGGKNIQFQFSVFQSPSRPNLIKMKKVVSFHPHILDYKRKTTTARSDEKILFRIGK